MYNRYIPQPDGSYQRNRMPDSPQATKQPPDKANPPPHEPQYPNPSPQPKHQEGIMGLFKNLLPKNIDTGDLIIILLILLMANDCEEDRNHALLTLALYFFL